MHQLMRPLVYCAPDNANLKCQSSPVSPGPINSLIHRTVM